MARSVYHSRQLMLALFLLITLLWCQPALAGGSGKIKRLENRAKWLFNLREDMSAAKAAIDTYKKILAADPSHKKAPLKLAKLYIWVGYHMGEDVKYYDKAVEVAKKAVEMHPTLPGPHYWYGVSLGLKATAPETGPFTCLSLLEPIETHMKKLIELDPLYEHGGPWRILGRLNTKTPFLLGGDKDLAEEYLRKAVKQGPQFYLNHLYLADLLSRRGKRDEAMSLVNEVLNGPPMKGLEPETKLWKVTAREVLSQQAKLTNQAVGSDR